MAMTNGTGTGPLFQPVLAVGPDHAFVIEISVYGALCASHCPACDWKHLTSVLRRIIMLAQHVRRMAAFALLLSVLLASTAQAATLIDQSLPLTVPAVGVPTIACVRVDNKPVCNPTPSTTPLTVMLHARLSENASLAITEGAPGSRGDGNNCARLAKTITVQLDYASQLSVKANTTPPVNQTVSGPTAPGAVRHKTIEVCVNSF